MGRQNALIRRLPAVETLGSVTDICSDKTGTLTRNRMRVRGFAIGGAIVQQAPAAQARTPDWELALKILALSNDITFAKDGSLQGEATELALCEAALEAGFDKRELERDHARLAEIPFSSERQRMSTLHTLPERSILKVKGAPESVLSLCAPLEPASGWTRQRIDECVEELARAGMRVLALAAREVSPDDHPNLNDIKHLEQDLRFVGLVGLMDPPRPEAARAIHQCHEAGIRVRMITGDHPATALATPLGKEPVTQLARVTVENKMEELRDVLDEQQYGPVRQARRDAAVRQAAEAARSAAVTAPEPDAALKARERNERASRAQQAEVDRWANKVQTFFDGFEW
jgi:Ca2+-transporting ATPase